ncbi:hypothetical protein FKM82_003858 [Ascaphus truei]
MLSINLGLIIHTRGPHIYLYPYIPTYIHFFFPHKGQGTTILIQSLSSKTCSLALHSSASAVVVSCIIPVLLCVPGCCHLCHVLFRLVVGGEGFHPCVGVDF